MVTRLLHRLAYVALRFAEALVRSSPPAVVVGAGRLIGSIWWAADPRRRLRVRENLRVLAAALPPGARPPTVVEAFRAMATVPGETLFAARILRGSARRRRIRFVGDWDALAADARDARPVVVVTAHLGNWEIGARLLRSVHPRMAAVVRPLGVPPLDAYVSDLRGGPTAVLPKRGAVVTALERLTAGDGVAIVADQDAGRRGSFVPFLGLPASTSPIPAVLARRSGASLYVGTCLRRPAPLTFDILLRRIHDGAERGRPAPIDEVTAAFTKALEAWVLQAPGQYNWLHRRWKSRPPEEPAEAGSPGYGKTSRAHA